MMRTTGRPRLVCALVLLICLCFCSLVVFAGWPLVASLFLAATVTLGQAWLLIDIADVSSRNNYLWISRRADYDEEYYLKDHHEQYELYALQRELAQVKAFQQTQLTALMKEVSDNSGSIKRIIDKLEA